MRLFKATYRDRSGNVCETAKWYGEFRDHLERVRATLYADHKASEEAGNRIDRLVNLKLAGGEPDADLTRWIVTMDGQLRDRLAGIGLLDASRMQATRLLSAHLDDFQTSLLAKGTTEQQAIQSVGRARKVLVDGCGFKHYSAISADAVRNFLTRRRQTRVVEVNGNREEKPGISAQTSNHILTSCKSFCAWMVTEGRAVSNPLNCLSPLSDKAVKQDMRHPRRVEPPATVAKLISTTAGQPEREGMNGAERALLYRLAVESGIRAGELAMLTRLSFRLDAVTPQVVIHDGSTKNGKDADVPLLPGTVELIRAHVADKLPGALVFAMPPKEHLSRMFYADLEAAGIKPCDESGHFFDFHSLRHCTATFLAERGVHPNTVRDIMRHGDLRTTLRYFKATAVAKRAEALESMPDLSTVAEAVKEATHDVPTAEIVPSGTAKRQDRIGGCGNMASAQGITSEPKPFAKPLFPGSIPGGALTQQFDAAIQEDGTNLA